MPNAGVSALLPRSVGEREGVDRMRRTISLVALVALALVLAGWASLVAFEEPAQATFPGENGKIAFQSSEGIYVVNPDGSGLQSIPIEDPAVSVPYKWGDPAWSPDASHLAFVGQRQRPDGGITHDLYVMRADGSGLTNITGAYEYAYLHGHPLATDPAWSPDGSKVAFAVYDGLDENGYIFTANADGSGVELLRMLPFRILVDGISWSPDGSEIAFGAVDIDENYETFMHSEVWVMSADGSELRVADPGLASAWQPSWSPDGTKIAFLGCPESGYNRAGCSYDVYVMGANGSDPVQLTDTPERFSELSPVWSPDGTKIAFLRNTETPPEILTVDADGSGQAEPVIGDQDPSGVEPMTDSSLDWGIKATDGSAPTVTRPRPKPGSTVYDRSPTISAVVRDAESELTKEDIQLWFDGRERGFSYDPDTDQLSRDTKGLAAGTHAVRIVATDEAGNQGTRRWSFKVVRQ
jgi:Tol biopolymer transport system component